MRYWLKQYDFNLLLFSMIEKSGDIDIQIIDINKQYRHLLPLDLEPANSSLKKWLKGRTIPRNRAYVSNFLSRMGLNVKEVKAIIIVLCHGSGF